MNYECGRSGSSSLFLAELSVKGPTKAKVQKQRKKAQLEIISLIHTFVSATFDIISTGFLLGYLYIKGAECLE